MIQVTKIYTVICDKCKKDISETDEFINQYDDLEMVEELAADEGWIKKGQDHYCPACYEKTH